MQRPPLPGQQIELDDPRTGPVQLYAGHSPTAPLRSRPMLLVHSVNAAASAYEVRPIYERFAATRPTYALDLPGFGLSDRSARRYTPRLMTDAIHAAIAHVRSLHAGAPVDALALSLSCEFLARAAIEASGALRTLALVSPTGLGRRRRDGPAGGTLGSDGLHAVLTVPLWRRRLFDLLTRPRVVRYFLRRTFGRKEIDEGLWAYAVETAHRPAAEHAPLWFVSGHLFSADATRLYEAIERPTWVAHGVRGDFVSYEGVEPLLLDDRWSRDVFETGALPHFECLDAFVGAYARFIDREHVNST